MLFTVLSNKKIDFLRFKSFSFISFSFSSFSLITFTTISLTLLSHCNYSGNTSGMHYLLDMHDSLAVEAQEEDYTNKKNASNVEYGMEKIPARSGYLSSMRIPPENTVPMKSRPYLLDASQFFDSKFLKNPVLFRKEVYEQGKKEYNTFCTPCHGALGKGQGTVAPYLGSIPSLVRREMREWQDGEMYHLITLGRGRMLPYAAQIEPLDRWRIILYIRTLQKEERKRRRSNKKI